MKTKGQILREPVGAAEGLNMSDEAYRKIKADSQVSVIGCGATTELERVGKGNQSVNQVLYFGPAKVNQAVRHR